jgi:peptidoglycan/LPS O-acetylase OafA/YrhL
VGAPRSGGRVAALTGLRGLAACSVVLYHTWVYGASSGGTFPSGPFHRLFVNLEIGQTFFFVLSGYLLYRPFGRALLTGSPPPKLSHFAIGRVLRIVPAYWTILLIVMALTERRFFTEPTRLLANMLFLQYAFPALLPPDLNTGNNGIAIVPAWSLVVEAGFYVTLPLACILGFRYMRRHAAPGVVASLVPILPLVLIGAAATVVEHGLSGDALRDWSANFPIHAGWFACGMLGTTVGLMWEHGRLSLPRRSLVFILLVSMSVMAVALKLHATETLSPLDYQWPVAASISAILLLVVVHADDLRLQRLLGGRLIVGIGLASYSIFLVHDPIIRAVRSEAWFSSTPGGFALTILVVAAGTALATTCSYRLLEKPSFAARRRLIAAWDERSRIKVRALEPAASELPSP